MAEQKQNESGNDGGIDKTFAVLASLVAKLPEKQRPHAEKLLGKAKGIRIVKDPDARRKYVDALKKAASCGSMLQSSDPAVIAQGALGMAAAACVMVPPPFGEAGAAVIGLASLVAGLFRKAQPSMADVLQSIVSKAHFEDIKANVAERLAQFDSWGSTLAAMDEYVATGDVTSEKCMDFLEQTSDLWTKQTYYAALESYATSTFPSHKSKLRANRSHVEILYFYATLVSMKVAYLQRMVYFYGCAQDGGYKFESGEYELKVKLLRNEVDAVLKRSASLFNWVSKCSREKMIAMACLKSDQKYAALVSFLQQCNVTANPDPPMDTPVHVKNDSGKYISWDDRLDCTDSQSKAAPLVLTQDPEYPGAFSVRLLGGVECYVAETGKVYAGSPGTSGDKDMSRWVAIGMDETDVGYGVWFFLTTVWVANKYADEDALYYQYSYKYWLDDTKTEDGAVSHWRVTVLK